jgi:hypothetical protein
MKKRLAGLVVAIVSFLPCLLSAQTYHRLTQADFAATPVADNAFAAYTNCYVSYSYNPVRHNGNYIIDFNVRVQVNAAKSWIRFDLMKNREMLSSVLRHEQGHYNIAYLMRNELYAAFTRRHYTANYQAEIVAVFKDIESKYHKINDDYEYQTQHMSNVNNQQQCDAWFSKQLDNAELAGNAVNGGGKANYRY